MPAGKFKTELCLHMPSHWGGNNKTDSYNQSSNLFFFFEWSMVWERMVNNLWCAGTMVGTQAHGPSQRLPSNPPFFWSPLSSWWGSEVGINCTSERLTPPLLPMPAEITGCCFCINIKIHSTVRESSFQSISIHNALTHKDGTVGNLDSCSSLSISLVSFLCSYMHLRQSYIQL